MSANPDPAIARFYAYGRDVADLARNLDVLVNRLNRYREALELVVAAGRPHRTLMNGDEACKCEGCRAYDSARRALE